MPALRYRGNLLLSAIVSEIAGIKIADSQSGFRVCSREVMEACSITSVFTYTQEQVIRAALTGVNVTEVPIHFGPRRGSKSRLMRSPFEYLARVAADLERLVGELRPELLDGDASDTRHQRRDGDASG
jgi:hypothetical protein